MKAREAFKILVMGTHNRAGRWESEELKVKAFRTPTRAFCPQAWNYVLLSGIAGWKKSAVLAAKEYYNTPKTWVNNDCLTFPSVYDLGLFLESQRIHFTPPQSMAFRGQCDFRWALLPSLARRPEAVSEEITKLISWLSVLISRHPILTKRSPLELIAIAQHYGYRTCLLDFTLDPLIAVAFACYGHTHSSDAEFGSVYYVYLSETEQLAPSTDLATGSLIRLRMDDVPRIKKQRGLFMGGFTRSALTNLLHIQRYLFRHSEDTHTFIQDIGLTDDELLPDAVLYGDESYVNQVSFVLILDKVADLLQNWATKCLRPMTWMDYYDIALSYAQTYIDEANVLTSRQKKRLRIFCRLFADLQRLPLPEHALTLLQLNRAVGLVCRYPDDASECRSFIEQFSNFRQSQDSLPAVWDALRRARFEEIGPHMEISSEVDQ